MKKYLVALCLILMPLCTPAWNMTGHRIIAQVAYDNLKPSAKEKINTLLHDNHWGDQFMDDAAWPDAIKNDDVHAFDTWHFIDTPYAPMGLPLTRISTENVVWAINQSENVLQSPNSKDYEKVLFLKFLLHFVGDVHQPLHCITRITKQHPQGDQGGNVFLIPTPDRNLHALWDNAFGFNINSTNEKSFVYHSAQQLEKEFPKSDFDADLKKTNPQAWADESFNLAKEDAYKTTENKKPSAEYMNKNKEIAKKRMALAGYRLAKLLNQTFR